MASNTHSANDLILGNFVVACIDILGQQRALEKFNDLTLTEENRAEISLAVAKTFGVVLQFRNRFVKFYENFQQKPVYNLSAEQARLLKKLSVCQIKTQTVSDTIIIATSFLPQKNLIPLIGIYAILVSCAAMFVDFLSGGVPLRGGITLGIAADTNDGGIYGPALREANYLEKERALFPRIVIGNKLKKLFDDALLVSAPEFAHHGEEIALIVAEATREYAKKCIRFIAKDNEGNFYLDYLGEGFRQIIDARGNKSVMLAHKFALDAPNRLSAEEKEKLLPRYECLIDYFQSRIHLWQ